MTDIPLSSAREPIPEKAMPLLPEADSLIGKVASPPGKEATSEEFFFWFNHEVLVEKGQVVRTEYLHTGGTIQFYGVVQEVYRQSRFQNLAEEYDRYDGQTDYVPPYEIPGVNYAQVSILRTIPALQCPPRDGANVFLGGPEAAQLAWRADEIEHKLAVGLIRNGGQRLAGPGCIDLDYLLGANGGHLNVNGVAGRATKSAFLLHMIWLLLHHARQQQQRRLRDEDRLKVVPIILNVKNFDLFHIDGPSKKFDSARDGAEWQELGIENPEPFHNVTWRAPQMKNGTNAIPTGRLQGDVKPYSYSLADVISRGLFRYLFSEEDSQNENFQLAVYTVEDRLTKEWNDGRRQVRELKTDEARTFQDLLEHIDDWSKDENHAKSGKILTSTWKMFQRRLLRMLLEGQGVLRMNDQHGHPLDVERQDTTDPIVIDLSALAGQPSLQRFVVAAIFRQLVEARTGSDARRGLVYLVTLDELNRFAPKGAKDPVTKLVEQVAAEMRSQGIILFGAQQQASLVSGRVIENAGLRAVGKSGSQELSDKVWKFLNPAMRNKAVQLQPEEKLLVQDSFREPMLVKIPRPPWALRREEVLSPPASPETVEDELDAP